MERKSSLSRAMNDGPSRAQPHETSCIHGMECLYVDGSAMVSNSIPTKTRRRDDDRRVNHVMIADFTSLFKVNNYSDDLYIHACISFCSPWSQVVLFLSSHHLRQDHDLSWDLSWDHVRSCCGCHALKLMVSHGPNCPPHQHRSGEAKVSLLLLLHTRLLLIS